MNRVMYREWFPQIVYNHHQTGPAGHGAVRARRSAIRSTTTSIRWFRPSSISSARRCTAGSSSEGKPGATMREGASYSTWWNGGLRTTVYFHNMIGLLTETIGNPTPIEIPFLPRASAARARICLAPIAPQKWHFRQSVDYSVTANHAVLDVASRNREKFLFNI